MVRPVVYAARVYPRRSRLGLIEATPQVVYCKIALGSIRGVRASASLKPLHFIGLEFNVAGYPRRSRLGLIEASAALPQVVSHCWYQTPGQGAEVIKAGVLSEPEIRKIEEVAFSDDDDLDTDAA